MLKPEEDSSVYRDPLRLIIYYQFSGAARSLSASCRSVNMSISGVKKIDILLTFRSFAELKLWIYNFYLLIPIYNDVCDDHLA